MLFRSVVGIDNCSCCCVVVVVDNVDESVVNELLLLLLKFIMPCDECCCCCWCRDGDTNVVEDDGGGDDDEWLSVEDICFFGSRFVAFVYLACSLLLVVSVFSLLTSSVCFVVCCWL